jgi:hypothetical protein
MRGAAALLLSGVLLPACGGEDLGRPAPPEPAPPLEETDWCEVAAEYEFLPVLDFEPAGTSAAICDVAGPPEDRCNWYAGSDTKHACLDKPLTMLRPSGNTAFPGEAIPEGRCGAPGTGLHVVGKRVAACIPEGDTPDETNGKIGWGANFQVDALPSGAPDTGGGACGETSDNVPPPGSVFFDASCWAGVSFWAKKSGPGGGSSLTVTVSDFFTVDFDDPKIVSCQTDEGVPDSTKCDPAGRVVTLTEDWAFYALPWDSLNQKGFGLPSLLGRVDSGNLKGVTLLIAPGDWDIWIDDVAFFRTIP